MPKKVTLSWNRALHRWRKIYRGRQWHSKVCDKSDREAYRRAVEEMKAWMKKVDEELEAEERERKTAVVAEELRERIGKQATKIRQIAHMFASRGMDDRAAEIAGSIAELERMPELLKSYEETPPIPIEAFAVERIMAQTSVGAGDSSRALDSCFEDFKDFKKRQINEKRVSPHRFDEVARNVGVFSNWIGAGTTSAINGDTLPEFRQHILATYQPRRAKNIFDTAKQFLRWCFERERLDALPRNFAAKELSIRVPPVEIVTWTQDQWKLAYGKATRRIRLYLLLMLNTGMYQGDIAELRQREVDWKEGRITRKRTKTMLHENVPVVSYPLWPETFELLREFRAKEGPFVVLTESGKQLVTNSIRDDDKLSRDDSVGTVWKRLKQAHSLNLPPLKCLRKTGATELAGEYGTGFATLYLGHAPRTIAEKHYIATPQTRFDEAVRWLGEKFPRSVPETVPSSG